MKVVKTMGYSVAGLLAFALGISMVVIPLMLLGDGDHYALISTVGKIVGISLSMLGVYVGIRAVGILMDKFYLPRIKLFGGKTLQSIQLMLVGFVVGLIAPLWAAVLFFGGACGGFLTDAFAGTR